MTDPAKSEIYKAAACATSGPLFGSNRMKLGIFGLNVSSAGGITAAPDRHEISWEQNVRMVKLAEAAGFEAAVPFARWRGFEGASNPSGNSYESYTWAAGIAAVTSRIAVFSTSNVMTLSPVLAAKALSTIDHISNGRAVLNVVSGWLGKELQMFGVGALDHDARYVYAEEWMEVLQRLLTQNETFDFRGKYITALDCYQQPKSIQSPRPPIMNAAFSPVGHDFATRWADIAFVSPDSGNPESAREKVQALRDQAAAKGRDIQIWVSGSVVCEQSEEQALAQIRHYIEDYGDAGALSNVIEWSLGGAKIPEEKRKTLGQGYRLLGNPQQVAEQIDALSRAGVDGMCLTWLNYEKGVPFFIDQVLPLLEKGGLRQTAA